MFGKIDMKINIEINNLSGKKIPVRAVKFAAASVIGGESKKQGDNNEFTVSIVFIGLEKIRKINKKYRDRNESTDVLSFVYDNCREFPVEEGAEALGELAICPEQVGKNAKEGGKTFKEEMDWVVVHGILHLLGYDHEKNDVDARKMRKKEKNYLKKILSTKF